MCACYSRANFVEVHTSGTEGMKRNLNIVIYGVDTIMVFKFILSCAYEC